MTPELKKTKSWKDLEKHFQKIKNSSLKELFKKDPSRFSKLSIKLGPILFDYSKNIITETTIKLLCALAKEMGLKEKIEMMFKGEKINVTEQRSVLHTAIRQQNNIPIFINGKNAIDEIQHTFLKINNFVNEIIQGKKTGVGGKRFKYAVNVGIGGSCLGPKMVFHALRCIFQPYLDVYFISNIDPFHIRQVLQKIQPEETLFIISSKSFRTKETLENAKFIKNWFLGRIKKDKEVSKHFIAVTANIKAAEELGISRENIFPMWEWVGGRFSLWSSIGLPVALAFGMENFKKLLEGANMVDEHFRTSSFEKNVPIIMAVLSIWYNNFFDIPIHMIIPYSEALKEFPFYLQQLEMESNGKSISLMGKPVDYKTGYIVVGGVGTDAQHSIFQLLHQGTHIIPCDFIVFARTVSEFENHNRLLIANCLAQSKALMEGKKEERQLYKQIPGNKPSNIFLIEELSPYSLGALIALYEHKIFVEGVIWNINSFDQWGVELGKELAESILNMLTFKHFKKDLDSSTSNLISQCLEFFDKHNTQKQKNNSNNPPYI